MQLAQNNANPFAGAGAFLDQLEQTMIQETKNVANNPNATQTDLMKVKQITQRFEMLTALFNAVMDAMHKARMAAVRNIA